MLDQRRRRWANIKPTLGERLVFAGNLPVLNAVRHVYTRLYRRDIIQTYHLGLTFLC